MCIFSPSTRAEQQENALLPDVTVPRGASETSQCRRVPDPCANLLSYSSTPSSEPPARGRRPVLPPFLPWCWVSSLRKRAMCVGNMAASPFHSRVAKGLIELTQAYLRPTLPIHLVTQQHRSVVRVSGHLHRAPPSSSSSDRRLCEPVKSPFSWHGAALLIVLLACSRFQVGSLVRPSRPPTTGDTGLGLPDTFRARCDLLGLGTSCARGP